MRTNAVCWNPMEAFNFAIANEDHNVYLYDMRRMDKSLNILKDHVSAVYVFLYIYICSISIFECYLIHF